MFRFNFLVLLVIFLVSTNFILNKESKNLKSKSKLNVEEPLLTEKFYTKTLGQIRFDKIKGRTPSKGKILECALKCSSTNGCHCIRVSVETNECNAFVSTLDDPNSETNASILNKYVYFTMNGNKGGNGENLALNKKVTQSSTYNQYQANKAVDNNNKTESKTHGSRIRKSGLPWLQIDLNEDHVITGLMLFTKDVLNNSKSDTPNPSESLHNFEIRVGSRLINKVEKNSHFKENPICYGFVGNKFLTNNEPRVVKCEPCPLMGKYVTIQIVNNCTDCRDPGYNALNLAEVAVYGYLPK